MAAQQETGEKRATHLAVSPVASLRTGSILARRPCHTPSHITASGPWQLKAHPEVATQTGHPPFSVLLSLQPAGTFANGPATKLS